MKKTFVKYTFVIFFGDIIANFFIYFTMFRRILPTQVTLKDSIMIILENNVFLFVSLVYWRMATIFHHLVPVMQHVFMYQTLK